MGSLTLLCALALAAGGLPVFAGDSLYGRVTAVKSANLVTLDNGEARYDLRLDGIEVPKEGLLAGKAMQFLTKMVLGKNARMRLEGRGPDGEFVGQLYTDDEVIGIKEVSVELVRAGLAQREKGFDSKYGEMSAAENEAKSARRGLWAADTQPR